MLRPPRNHTINDVPALPDIAWHPPQREVGHICSFHRPASQVPGAVLRGSSPGCVQVARPLLIQRAVTFPRCSNSFAGVSKAESTHLFCFQDIEVYFRSLFFHFSCRQAVSCPFHFPFLTRFTNHQHPHLHAAQRPASRLGKCFIKTPLTSKPLGGQSLGK